MAPPTPRAATKLERSANDETPFRSEDLSVPRPGSELLLHASEEAARRPELSGEDPDAGAVAQHVVLAEHVDDVEARLHRPDRGPREALGDPEVELLVGRVGRVVRVAHGAPQPAADQQVEAHPGLAPEIREPGRG